MDTGSNRREYYRIDDRIALRFKPLTEGLMRMHEDNFNAKRRELGLVNHFAANREKHRVEMKRIEQKLPEIAAYLKFLEEEIEVLATRLATSDSNLPDVPTHDVNICAEGLRTELNEPVPVGQYYEMSMMLFPSHTTAFVVGEVIRCDKITEGDELQIGQYETVIKFVQIHDEDKEAMVKHIHQKQLLVLQERQSAMGLE